jgi:hypothetical protein
VRIIEKLKGLDLKELAVLEANARRVLESGSSGKKAEAETLLAAINGERIRRSAEEGERRRTATEDLKARVKDLGLFDRAVLAFEEMPPTDREVTVLKAIAANPGKDFHFLAKQIGDRDGGAINLAVGTLCSYREHYLGEAPPPVRPGERNKAYSALIIDYTRHEEPGGSEWHGWTLKPEVRAALEHLRII